MQFILKFTTLFLLLTVVSLEDCFAQKKKKLTSEEKIELNIQTQNNALCNHILWVLNSQRESIDRTKFVIDSIISKGASVDCQCDVTTTQYNLMNILGNTITNSLSKFFLHRSSKPFNEKDYLTQKYPPVVLLAGKGYLQMIEHLVTKHKVNINAKTENNFTAFDLIVSRNKEEEIKWIANLGADVSLTPLCITNEGLLDFLISKGATVKQFDWKCILEKSDKERTFSNTHSDLIFLKFIKKYKPDLSSTEALRIPRYLPPEALELIYASGLPVNSRTVIDYLNDNNSSNFIPYTKLFIKYHANLSQCEMNDCPIELAVKRSTIEAVHLIADNGGLNPSEKIYLDKPELCEILIKKGLPTDSIYLLCLFENELLLKKILETYKPSLTFYQKGTTLKNITPRILELLITHGLVPSIELLDHIANFRSSELTTFLKIYINHRFEFDRVNMMAQSIDNNNLAAVKLLVNDGFSKKEPFNKNETPHQYALRKGRKEIAEFLK